MQFATTQQEEKRSRGRGGRRQAKGSRKRIDWSNPERAGLDHPGRISRREQEYVQTHLEEVNARRREAGQRELDPNNTEDAERYGLLPQPSEDTASIEETTEIERSG